MPSRKRTAIAFRLQFIERNAAKTHDSAIAIAMRSVLGVELPMLRTDDIGA